MNKYIDKMQRKLGKYKFFVYVCVKIRNQSNAIIGAYLGQGHNLIKNGELDVIKSVAPECNYFVDVGANIGEWSDHFIKYSGACGTIYEPSEEAYNILLNKYKSPNINVKNLALGEINSNIAYIEIPGCGETSAIADVHGPTNITPRTVRIRTLDSEFVNSTKIIDYLKIDTEGYDCKVLLGSNKLMENNRIRFIQF